MTAIAAAATLLGLAAVAAGTTTDGAMVGTTTTEEHGTTTTLLNQQVDVDTEDLPKVTFSMTVNNVNYNDVTATTALETSFKTSCRTAIANTAGAGVTKEDVEVELSEGSVQVDAIITVADDTAAQAAINSIDSGNLASNVVSELQANTDLSNAGIATGSISVTGITTPKVEDPDTEITNGSVHVVGSLPLFGAVAALAALTVLGRW